LSPEQAQAILELRLHRLTALEQDKIIDEYNALIEQIKYFLSILNDEQKLIAVIKDELIEVKNNYGEERRTSIEIDTSSITTEDLIPKEDLLVTMSSTGYIKTQSLDNYRQQHRGGRGKTAAKVKEDDFITNAFVANSHETLLCFTSLGKVFWLKVYQLPKVSTTSKGKPIVNLLPLGDGEKIQSILPVNEFNNDKFIFFATQNGTVKKTSLEQYSRPRANGIIAIDIKDNDELISTEITDGNNEIMLFTQSGKSIKFDENKVRSVGRSASGVKGIDLAENDKVISMIIPKDDANVLIATENGFGKQTPVSLFSLQGRAGKGVIAINTSERNGFAVSALMVQETDEVMLITTQGTLVRISADEIAQSGRNTQGVTLIKPDENDKLSKMLKIIFTDDEINDD